MPEAVTQGTKAGSKKGKVQVGLMAVHWCFGSLLWQTWPKWIENLRDARLLEAERSRSGWGRQNGQ